ncbi:trimethylguanosine synthase-like [Acyrthosiphon pisum]|uniref:Trimethylguanosine synthase n=1 Tax=Acyrthosiphon pisum TaxID=7029 RepID=A0A8R2NT79_ACYPI|nr:trimethylguanosine synthase-like [Acyrthosiphon pisum]
MFVIVIAVDIDADKIIMAKQNAAIYGVGDKIEFIVGDYFKLENQIKGDVIVTSPPWGGPEYSKMDVIGPLDLYMDKILEVGKTIAPKILLHLPKNLNKNECWKMCNGVGASLRKIENVFMNKYLNSTLFYVRSNNVSYKSLCI